jgi:hypothetical protein
MNLIRDYKQIEIEPIMDITIYKQIEIEPIIIRDYKATEKDEHNRLEITIKLKKMNK